MGTWVEQGRFLDIGRPVLFWEVVVKAQSKWYPQTALENIKPGLEVKEIKKGTRQKMPKSLFLHGAETQS